MYGAMNDAMADALATAQRHVNAVTDVAGVCTGHAGQAEACQGGKA